MAYNMDRYPEQESITCYDSIRSCVRFFYNMHLILIAVYMTLLIIFEQGLRYKSFTFPLLCFYCYMVVWVFLINMVLVFNRMESSTVWFNRLVVKFLIMIYPILGFIAYLCEYFFLLRSVGAIMIYMFIFSVTLIIFQIYTCTCAEEKNPDFLFEENDLKGEINTIANQRKGYLANQKEQQPT